jgi:hypothetical protein
MRAMTMLVRAREDAVAMQRQARQRLQALLLRNEIRYVGRSAWTAAHRRWIAKLKLPNPAQQIAFEEYVQAVEEAGQRLERLAKAIAAQLEHWRWRPVVAALQALRGVSAIHAVRIVAKLGNLALSLRASSWPSASSEDSSAPMAPELDHQSGQQLARRAMVEAAGYGHPARVSWVIARRQTGLPKSVCDIAWKAQLRLCARFRKLAARRVPRNKVVVAVARELSGFVWAIAQLVKPVA